MSRPFPTTRPTLAAPGAVQGTARKLPAGLGRSQPWQDKTFADRSLSGLPGWDFFLPPELEAGEPPEARGLPRDQVRLMVSRRASHGLHHAILRCLPDFLLEGDLLVVNTSATLNAALPAVRAGGQRLVLHLSTRQPDGDWLVELRQPVPGPDGSAATMPWTDDPASRISPGETLSLPGGARAVLHGQYVEASRPGQPESPRLRRASLILPWRFDPSSINAYLDRYGSPIRYRYVRGEWPLEYYQTIFARHPGSAEMPSAGRAFSHAVVADLAARGVALAPLVLHTGVASPEAHEPPYTEYFRLPERTARMVNAAHERGARVIAVGTTVVRALESAPVTGPGSSPVVQAAEGWTDLVVTPRRGVSVVEGLLTGLHEPNSTHLAMLEAFAGRELLQKAYKGALEQGYLWHEFGDLHLILP